MKQVGLNLTLTNSKVIATGHEGSHGSTVTIALKKKTSYVYSTGRKWILLNRIAVISVISRSWYTFAKVTKDLLRGGLCTSPC